MDTDDLHKSVFPKMKKEIHDLEYGVRTKDQYIYIYICVLDKTISKDHRLAHSYQINHIPLSHCLVYIPVNYGFVTGSPDLILSSRSPFQAGHERRDSAPPVATAARKFIQEQLTPEALSCYWLKVTT